MGIQFADKDFKRSDAIVLSFRKPITHEADKVAELAEKSCCETFDLKFQEMFSFSVEDMAVSTVAKELEGDKVECDMHQGDKVGASAVGELSRTVNKENSLFICIVVVL